MPVDVQQRADAELGAAFRRAEAALPEGWHIDRFEWEGHNWHEWFVSAQPCPGCRGAHGSGPTIAAALDALTEALANR